MAQNSWPSPTHNSRNVTDSEYEKIASRFSDNGIDGDPNSSPVVTAGSGLQVLVKAGKYGTVRGHAWYSGASDDPLAISTNSSGATRIDRVVLRLDRSTWDVRAVVREGTPGSGAPALVQDTGDVGVYEILLGEVTVPNGAVSVTVTNRPQFVGSRIRPEIAGAGNPNPALGEISFRDGKWLGHTGSGNLVTLYGDSGDQALSIGYTDRWESAGDLIGRKVGNIVSATINLKRIGETFSENDTDGSYVALLPTSLRPQRVEYFACRFTNGASGRLEVRTDGQIWCNHLSASVGTGRFLRATMMWIKTN